MADRAPMIHRDSNYAERESQKFDNASMGVASTTAIHYDGTLNMTRMICTLGPSCWSVARPTASPSPPERMRASVRAPRVTRFQ